MIRAQTQYGGGAFSATLLRVKPPYDFKRRLRETGKSQAKLAAHLGISKDSAFRLVNGARDVEATEHERAVAWIEGGVEEPAPRFELINVYGYAAAGGEGRIALADDRVIDRIEVPVGLIRGEAFAIRVSGDSMEPRLMSGETVIVGRDVAPSKYGDCVVEFRDGTAVVKQYRGQKDSYVFLHQFNPEQEVRVAWTTIKSIHAVLLRR